MQSLKKHKPTHFRRNTLYAMMMLALAVPHARADNLVWTGNQSSDFNDVDNNWINVENDEEYYNIINTPANGVDPELIIEEGGMVNVGGNFQIGRGQGESGRLTVSKSSDASYNTIYAGNMQVGLDGGRGELTVHHNNDPALEMYERSVMHAQLLNVGQGSDSFGTVNILGSGKALTDQNPGTATVQTSRLNVGLDGGTGAVNIDGASLDVGMGVIHIGSGSDSVGEVNVLGGGKIINGLMESGELSAIASIGEEGGTGTLNVSGSSSEGYASNAHFGKGLTVGSGEGSTGIINVTDGAQLITHGKHTSEWGEDIRLIQLGVDGGRGAVSVDGQNSIWMVAGDAYMGGSHSNGEDTDKGKLYIGYSGQGEVTLSNGGTLTIGEINISSMSDPITGEYYTGIESFVDGTGTLYLGTESDGEGVLNIGAAQGNAAQGAGILKAASVEFGAGKGAIVFNHTDNSGNYSIDAALNGGNSQSYIQQIAGHTNLSSLDNTYAGNFDVLGGKLTISGEILNSQTTQVSGGVLDITGKLGSVNTLVSGGELIVNGTMDVGNIAQVAGGSLIVNGTMDVGNTAQVTGGSLIVDVNGSLDVGKDILLADSAVSINGTMNVNDAAQVTGGSLIVDVNGSLDVGKDILLAGSAVSINGAMNVNDAAQVTGGSLIVNGSLDIGKDALLADSAVSIDGTMNVGNMAQVTGGSLIVGVNGSLDIGQDIRLTDSAISISGAMGVGNTAQVTGGSLIVDVNGSLDVGQDALLTDSEISINGAMGVGNSAQITNGSLVVSGSLDVGQNALLADSEISINGAMSVGNTAQITNGSLVVNGSLDVVQDALLADSAISINGAMGVGNSAQITNGSLVVSGSLDIGQDVRLTDSIISINGSLDVGQNALLADSAISINGAMEVGNTVQITNGSLIVDANGSLDVGQDALLADSAISINGAMGVDNKAQITDGSLIVDANGSLDVGQDALLADSAIGINGAMGVGNKAQITGGWLIVNGSLDVGQDALLANSATGINGAMNVGNTAQIIGGSLIVNGSLDAGQDALLADSATGINGTMNVGNTAQIIGGSLIVNGSLDVGQDAELTDSEISIGGAMGVGNTAQVTGGSLVVDVNGSLNVGQDAHLADSVISINGTMNVGNTAQVTGGVLNVNGTMNASSTSVTNSVANVLGRLNSNVAVDDLGLLTGTGYVGHTTMNSGATVAPGASLGEEFGTLSFDSIEFNEGSIYQVKVNPDGQTDLIRVSTQNGGTGLAILNGGTVNVQSQDGAWKENTKYTIVDADAEVIGQFDDVTSNLAFLDPTLQKDAQHVYLFLTRNDVAMWEIGETPNQHSTGWGIENLLEGNPIYDAVLGMSRPEALAAYDNLSGEIHASVQGAILSNSRYARKAVSDHLTGLQTDTVDARRNLWVDTWGHKGDFKRNERYNVEKLRAKGYGFIMGNDFYHNGQTTIGAALGYERTELSLGGVRNSDADIDAIHVLAYGRTAVGAVDVKGGVGYTWLDVDSTRHVTVPTLISDNKASYNSGVVQIFAEGSHTFDVSESVGISPYVGLAYQHMNINSFTEKGGDTVLHVSRRSKNLWTSTLGVRGYLKMSERAQAYADLGWLHNFGRSTPDAKLNFIGGKGFHIKGNKINDNNILLGVGAKFRMGSNMELTMGYEGEFGRKSTDHSGKILWELHF